MNGSFLRYVENILVLWSLNDIQHVDATNSGEKVIVDPTPTFSRVYMVRFSFFLLSSNLTQFLRLTVVVCLLIVLFIRRNHYIHSTLTRLVLL